LNPGGQFDLFHEMDLFFTGGCTEERKEKCLARSGKFFSMLCRACRLRDYRAHPYLTALYELAYLRLAGFPLAPDDVPLTTWYDLGAMMQRMQPRLM